MVRRSKRKILAFVHLQKAAGTTLIHLLRLNFFLRYCDVRVLYKDSNKVFQAKDMRKVLAINPFTRCIAGHAVKPYGTLSEEFPNVQFITLLREPIQRYLSQYQYKVEKMGHDLTFEEFMEDKESFNKQTRQLTGSENLNLAKDYLANRFLLVGTVDEFDAFLILLKRKLEPYRFKAGYKVQNIGRQWSPVRRRLMENYDIYFHKIEERNHLDIELYNYVKNELLPIFKSEYGPDFEEDLAEFKRKGKKYSHNFLRYLDYVLRKYYYDPIFRAIRRRNGLPPRGVY